MPNWALSRQGTLGRTATTTEASEKHYWIAFCKLPAHMHDKVSVVDRFRLWFSSRDPFQGAKSIVMQTSIVFRPNFREVGGGGGQKSLRWHPM